MNEPEQAVQGTFRNLMKAIQANRYFDFIREGNWPFKIGINILMFWFVTAQLARRMRQGYEAVYLGQLNQKRHQVYLWKLTFKDGGTQFLARLAIKNGRASGLLIT